MKVSIGIDDKNRKALSRLLRRLLANESVLLAKTRNYHWNVVSSDFGALHKLFDEQYEALSEAADEVAERIRSLGEFAPGTLAEFLEEATLKEQPGDYPKDARMIANLLADHEQVVRELRKDVDEASRLGDAGTGDFLTGLMEEHEKTAWMLRAHLA